MLLTYKQHIGESRVSFRVVIKTSKSGPGWSKILGVHEPSVQDQIVKYFRL